MLKKLLCKDNFDPYITRRLNCNNAGAHVVHLKKRVCTLLTGFQLHRLLYDHHAVCLFKETFKEYCAKN